MKIPIPALRSRLKTTISSLSRRLCTLRWCTASSSRLELGFLKQLLSSDDYTRYFVLRAVVTVLLIVFAYFSNSAKAEIIFEGYYKINLGEKHAGYAIQRYEFDAKKKRFKSTYFIQTSELLGNLQESVTAEANEKFEPQKYQYTTKVGEAFKIIDAKFQKNMLLAKASNGKQTDNISIQVAKGSFLSTFLGYVMLNNGYQVGKKYSYKAIAEEDAKLHDGTALIKEEVKYMGMQVYRILNNFKGSKFVSLVSKTGEVLKTLSPLQRISTELVKSPSQATAGFQLPQKSLSILFGSVPTGSKNTLSKASPASKAAPSVDATDHSSSGENIKHKTVLPPKKYGK